MEMNIDFDDGIFKKNILRVIFFCIVFDLYIELIMIIKLYFFLFRWREKVYELFV